MKIYSNDPLVHYATTELGPERTRDQINGILAEYGIKKIAWNFDIPREVLVLFDILETIDDMPIKVAVKVHCPTIWDPARPRAHDPKNRLEQINWKISMRAMYWYIKTHLETAYAMQSTKTVAFLGFIQSADPNKTLKDFILPQLKRFAQLEVRPTPKLAPEETIILKPEVIPPNKGEQNEEIEQNHKEVPQ
jgi:hypothetical protein